MNEIDPHSELIEIYLTECSQMLQSFEKIILDSDKSEQLLEPNELFRLLHTLKGSSAMMEFSPLVDTAHRFENILSEIKSASRPVTGEKLLALTDVGLVFASYFKQQFSRISSGNQPQINEKLCEAIDLLAKKINSKSDSTPDSTATNSRNSKELSVTVKLRNCPLPHIRAFIVAKAVIPLCALVETVPESIEKADDIDAQILSDGFIIKFVPNLSVSHQEIIDKITAQPYVESCTKTSENSAASLPAEQSDEPDIFRNVTVSQTAVNSLISMIGDIASAEGLIEAYAAEAGIGSGRLYGLFSALRHTISDANVLACEIGMHDVGSVFIQMQRTVRTMAKELGKEIKVKTIGDDVRVDKSILEILSDSLIHIVRNSADHGIEMPAERVAAAKPQAGTITLSAEKKNDYLIITVTDDGRGIRRKAVLDRVEKSGKLNKPKEQYTDREVNELILSSGISTNASVTKYSGRGVGLDTVVRRIKQSGGRVFVQSKEGSGTAFTLKIPITLMLIDGIEITAENGNEIIVPLNCIRKIFSVGQSRNSYTRLSSGKIKYHGEEYSLSLFPGTEASHESSKEKYIILFERDYGLNYINAEKVSMMSSYYVKPLPELIADTLGSNYIYSGCVSCSNSTLRCVLDAGRLIAASYARVKQKG